MKPSVPLAFLAGLVLLAIALVLALSRSPLVLARTNAVPEAAEIAVIAPGTEVCQGGETLPGGTSAIRLAINTGVGPSVALQVRAGARVIAHGSQVSGWRGASVTVPLARRAEATTRAVSVCATPGPSNEPLSLVGAHQAPGSPASNAGRVLRGRMQIEYLRPGAGTWWSHAGAVARHMGLGRAWSGGWVAFFVSALIAVIGAATSWVALRGLR